jgi:hypothetical protein
MRFGGVWRQKRFLKEFLDASVGYPFDGVV